jgi:beta-glucosidase
VEHTGDSGVKLPAVRVSSHEAPDSNAVGVSRREYVTFLIRDLAFSPNCFTNQFRHQTSNNLCLVKLLSISLFNINVFNLRGNMERLLQELTLQEKAALCSGINLWETTPIFRLQIPSAFFADGPHGVRREYNVTGVGNIMKTSIPATCFPPAATLGNSWDKDLLFSVGVALGDECLTQKVSVLLGPGVNIKRSPLCGRNFEYFSEDPVLAGELAVAYINGVQSLGVGTSLKHFAANNQEYKRHIVSSEIDERTFREIYLLPFEIAINKAKPYTVMCCYNKINGIHGSDNKKLLTDILRTEWGFDGLVMSDWGAVNDRVAGVKAGMNIEMPSSNGENDAMIIKAVECGELTMADLDKCVLPILKTVFKCFSTHQANMTHTTDYVSHHALARRAAASGAVLLKNDDEILPLKRNLNFAVVGRLAKNLRAQGSGSSQVKAINNVDFITALDNASIPYEYADGYKLKSAKSEKRNSRSNDSLVEEAKRIVANKDVVLLFIGLTEEYESEAFDRKHMDIPLEHVKLLDALFEVNKNIIVILTGGSPVSMPWLDKAKAILNLYLGGEAGGEAAADLIFGDKNPSGKLAETYPILIHDCPSTPYFGKDIAQYRESVFVGYRYYDTAHKNVLFPFGYGLSYTRFEYSDIKISSHLIDSSTSLTVTFAITNVGRFAGAEIAQLYVKDVKSTVFRPEKELKAFDKVTLDVGETSVVELSLDYRAFSFYNIQTNTWAIEPGEFEILIGASSRDIRLTQTVTFEGDVPTMPNYKLLSPAYYSLPNLKAFPDSDFEGLLGRKLEDYIPPKTGTYDMNTLVGDLEKGNWFARLFSHIFKKSSQLILPKDASFVLRKMAVQGAKCMPIRNFYMMSGGVVPYSATTALLKGFNGKPLRGLLSFMFSFIVRKNDKKNTYLTEK